MKTLTVITTTYNRAYCLHQLYESLCCQTSNDFVWLVVDDGSTDNTKDLVYKWILQNKIVIEYFYRSNGGLHRARNTAYDLVETELNVIIDSDDWLKDYAVEKIVNFWKINNGKNYYGIISLNVSKNGKLIGSELPNIKACTLSDLFGKYHVKGDKKLILRSDLSRLYPYPEFEGEKFYPPSYKYRMLDLDYKLLIMNEIICVVDYNFDSMSFNKFFQYKTSSRGFAHYRNEMIRLSRSPKYIIRHMIHYIAEAKISGDKNYLRHSSRKIYAVICWPFGLMLYWYLNHTSRKF